MLTINSQAEMKRNHFTAAHQQFCPDCRGIMDEVERRNENGVLYVWYKCTRDGCDGQWLEQKRGA